MSNDPGRLYVIATPIGNLEDITLRAIRVLGEVDLIAAEHVPVARTLLRHFEIDTQVIPYHDRGHDAQRLVERMHKGQSVALVSDAGTPGVSDPGRNLIGVAVEAEIQIVPIPGPAASIALWSVSGCRLTRCLLARLSAPQDWESDVPNSNRSPSEQLGPSSSSHRAACSTRSGTSRSHARRPPRCRTRTDQTARTDLARLSWGCHRGILPAEGRIHHLDHPTARRDTSLDGLRDRRRPRRRCSTGCVESKGSKVRRSAVWPPATRRLRAVAVRPRPLTFQTETARTLEIDNQTDTPAT